MIRGAIFDIDGTILDSMPIWDVVAEEYLLSLGITPRENLTETFKTFTVEQSAHYYQEVYGVRLSTEEIIKGVNGIIEDFYRTKAPLKPGAERFLRGLKRSGIRMCIATATDEELIRAALTRLGVFDLFSGIYTCIGVGHSKKEPHIYREARRFLGTEKKDTWVFEDAFHAAQTAKDDGFPVAAVYDKAESEQENLKHISDLYFETYPEFDPDLFQ